MPLDEDMLRQLWEANVYRPGTLPDAAMGFGPQTPQTWKGYPLQPNGLPDLSSVGAFGEQGFRAGVDEFGPQLLREEVLPWAMGPVVRVGADGGEDAPNSAIQAGGAHRNSGRIPCLMR